MKIWFQTFEWPPDFGGGLCTYMKNVTRMLAENGHEVTVLYRNGKLTKQREIHEEGPNLRVIHFSDDAGFESRGTPYWVNVSRLFAEVTEEAIKEFGKPDVLEMADGFACGYYTLLKREAKMEAFMGFPIICKAHTPIYLMHRANRKSENLWEMAALFEMEKACYALADLVAVPSHFLKELLMKDLGIAEEKLRLTRYPFYGNGEERESLEPEKELDGFYMASRVEYWKGARHLAHEMNPMWEAGLEAPLVFYGDDTYDEYDGGSIKEIILKRFPKAAEANKIQFRGRVPREQIEEETKNAYAQIHASIQENFPFAVIENMSAGRITIASKSGGQAEMVEDGVSGFIYSYEEEGSFQHAVERCMNLTPQERMQMRSNALSRISELTNPKKIYPEKLAEYNLAKEKYNQRNFSAKAASSDSEVTVAIVEKNSYEGLEGTLKSALECNYNNKNILVCGNEDFLEQAKELTLNSNEQITFVREDSPRFRKQLALAKASGQYLVFLSEEVRLDERYLEEAAAYLDCSPELDFVTSWYELVTEDESFLGRVVTGAAESDFKTLFHSWEFETALLRKQALDKKSFDTNLERPLQDWDLQMRLLMNGGKGGVVPDFLHSRRMDSIADYRWQRRQSDLELINRRYAKSDPMKFSRALPYGLLNNYNEPYTSFGPYIDQFRTPSPDEPPPSPSKSLTEKLFGKHSLLRRLNRERIKRRRERRKK